MIEEFWGLKEKPFLNTPDTKFIFPSGGFKEALSRLLYHIKEVRGGISLITGEVGCGKTLLSVKLLQSLPDDKYCKTLVINPKFTQTQFLRNILDGFGEDRSIRSRYAILKRLIELLNNNIKSGKENILIIDEAQLLSSSLIEEVRLLTNYESAKKKYVQIVLFGQPELEKKIKNIEQFNQRIQVRYHLEGMNRDETKNYILHRLTLAGAKEKTIFSESAFSKIYSITNGIPRIINNICENALFIAYSLGEKSIDAELIKDVALDLGIKK